MELIPRLLINSFDAVAGIVFVTSFTKSDRPRGKQYFLLIIALIALAFVAPEYNTNPMNLYYDFNWSPIKSAIRILIMLVVSLRYGRSQLVFKILSPFIFESIAVFLNSIQWLYILNLTFNTTSTSWGLSAYTTFIVVLISKLMMASILFFIVKTTTYNGRHRFLTILTYILAPIFTMFSLYIFVRILLYRVNEYNVETIIAIVGTATVNIISFLLFNKTVVSEAEYGELQIYLNKTELERQSYAELLKMSEEINSMKHDMKNQLLCVSNCLEKGDVASQEKYIHTLSKTIDSIGTPLLTGNSLIDYIISSKISNVSDVKVAVVGSVDTISAIDDIDLSVLIGNILDNALEAVLPIQSEEKLIEFSFSEFQGYRNIVVKNSIVQSVLETNEDLHTTKNEKGRHGFGVRSIRNIVDKYNGFVRFYEEENKFCVHIALPL